MKLFVRPGGSVEAVYHDDLAPVMESLGPVTVKRTGRVEPCHGVNQALWWGVTIDGVVTTYWSTRASALAFEERLVNDLLAQK